MLFKTIPIPALSEPISKLIEKIHRLGLWRAMTIFSVWGILSIIAYLLKRNMWKTAYNIKF